MKTIAEIKAEFAAADMSSYPALYEIYKEDTRSGVQKLIAQCRKKEAALEAEKHFFISLISNLTAYCIVNIAIKVISLSSRAILRE